MLQTAGSGGAGGVVGQAEGGDVLVHNNGAETQKFIVQDDGSVGVGTTSPGQKLTVDGTIRAGGSTEYVDMSIWSF